MPHKLLLLLLATLAVASQACTTDLALPLTAATVTPTPVPTPVPTPPFDQELTRLADEFQTLRAISGQFGGGEWHDDVDQWQGRKHQVMLALEEALGAGKYDCSQLTTLLGPADHVVIEGDTLFINHIQSLPEYNTFATSDVFLVYEWRGTHDFLFFAIQNDQVTASGWWHAGE